MPTSKGGQHVVAQQEEEEVGEGAREQEFGQQDEEQVVKRRIHVSRRPTSRKGVGVSKEGCKKKK